MANLSALVELTLHIVLRDKQATMASPTVQQIIY